MTWFKVDDGFAFHPKAGAAGNAALGLWVRAGSWCAQQLTDGDVPKDFLRVLGGKPKDAQALVDVGLWDVTEKGWRFHDWSRFQPSKEQVLAERRSNAARQQVARSPELRAAIRERDGDNCRYCGREVRWTDRRGSLGGTYDHVIPDGPSDYDNLVVCCRGCNASKGHRTPEQAGMELIQVGSKSGSKSGVSADPSSSRPPTRPDPTRPGNSYGVTSEEPAKPASIPRSRGVGTRIPDPFIIDEAMKDWAVDRGYTAEWCVAQTERFVNYWTAKPGKDGTKSDWRATWRNWILKAADDLPANKPQGDLFDRAMERAQQRLEIVQ